MATAKGFTPLLERLKTGKPLTFTGRRILERAGLSPEGSRQLPGSTPVPSPSGTITIGGPINTTPMPGVSHGQGGAAPIIPPPSGGLPGGQPPTMPPESTGPFGAGANLYDSIRTMLVKKHGLTNYAPSMISGAKTLGGAKEIAGIEKGGLKSFFQNLDEAYQEQAKAKKERGQAANQEYDMVESDRLGYLVGKDKRPIFNDAGNLIDLPDREKKLPVVNTELSKQFGYLIDNQGNPVLKEGKQIPLPKGEVNQKELFNMVSDITGKIRLDPDVKDFILTRDGYERVVAGFNQPEGGVGDISMIFGYMKMLDPASVVREGEFATAENAGGAFQQYGNLYNKLLRGDKLPPQARKNMLKQAKTLYESKFANYNEAVKFYKNQADVFNVPVDLILRDFTSEAGTTSGFSLAEPLFGGSLVSKKPDPSKVISGFDFSSYASDTKWGDKVNIILSKMPTITNGSAIDNYIKRFSKKSPVTGNMIISSAQKFNIPIELMIAIARQESNFGTAGRGARTFNVGNVGNVDSGANVDYGDWQTGLDVLARNISRRRLGGGELHSGINPNQFIEE